jgi:hypothetical protein
MPDNEKCEENYIVFETILISVLICDNIMISFFKTTGTHPCAPTKKVSREQVSVCYPGKIGRGIVFRIGKTYRIVQCRGNSALSLRTKAKNAMSA